MHAAERLGLTGAGFDTSRDSYALATKRWELHGLKSSKHLGAFDALDGLLHNNMGLLRESLPRLLYRLLRDARRGRMKKVKMDNTYRLAKRARERGDPLMRENFHLALNCFRELLREYPNILLVAPGEVV
jgi:hypothetical protein